jgi:hypothetical protein
MMSEYFFSIPIFWGIIVGTSFHPWQNLSAIIGCIIIAILHFKMKEVFSLNFLFKFFIGCLLLSLFFLLLFLNQIQFKLLIVSEFAVLFTLFQVPMLIVILLLKIKSKNIRNLVILIFLYPIICLLGWALFHIDFAMPNSVSNSIPLTTWIKIEEEYSDFIDESWSYDIKESKFLLFEKVTPITKWGSGLKYPTSFFLKSKRNDTLEIGVSWNKEKIADTTFLYTNCKIIDEIK